MTTMNVGNWNALPWTATLAADTTNSTDATSSTEPTAEEVAFAKQYPAGPVQIERTGLKTTLHVTGGIGGIGGALILGASLLGGRSGGAVSRPLTAALVAGGAMVGVGALSLLGAAVVKPETRIAVASGLPTQAMAGEFAGKMVGRQYSIKQDIHGKWAVFDEGPLKNTRGYNYGRDHYYGRGSHYTDYYNQHGYYEPYYPGRYDYGTYYPGYPSSYPDPWEYQPSGGYPSGGTSRGDSYPSSGGGYSSGGSTSRGDDSGGSSYDPPSYDPPSYDPPSYDPPSYDPPDYGGGYSGGSSWGDSSSNGNPSYDDF
ncbi:MAG: hypothetical protein KDC46_13135 [Thermoleophilia bacterium]|nr:hypothetical protein [Thermoleophilia bacterium]